MTTLNQLSTDLAKSIAIALQPELQQRLILTDDDFLKSIKIKKVRNDYIITMREDWKKVEYLENPFIRFTLNTKMKDILKKITRQLSV